MREPMAGAGKFLILSILGSVMAGCGATPSSDPVAGTHGVPLDHLPALSGGYFEQLSKETGRCYYLYVRLPEGYAKAPAATRYPVVYLLDGDSLFPLLAPEHLFLTYDENLQEAIVVGIAYGSFDPSINKRDVDFSGPAQTLNPERAGAPAFQRYLKNELIPVIERKYRSDPDLFWGRIASNPSFSPEGDLFFSDPAKAVGHDLGLVVTSGTRDRPALRDGALRWFRRWDGALEAPWTVKTVSIEGGTHAADAANSYRAGMLWLFRRNAAP